jgi:hypothetical protein
MFTLVRRFIKTGIMFLFAGLAVGAWLLVRRELFGIWPHPHLVSAHTHAVQVGFVMFLIFGVALWLFPRPPKDDTRYSPRRITLAYWILARGHRAPLPGGTRSGRTPARRCLPGRWWWAASGRWRHRRLLPGHVAADPAGGQSPAGGAGRTLLTPGAAIRHPAYQAALRAAPDAARD